MVVEEGNGVSNHPCDDPLGIVLDRNHRIHLNSPCTQWIEHRKYCSIETSPAHLHWMHRRDRRSLAVTGRTIEILAASKEQSPLDSNEILVMAEPFHVEKEHVEQDVLCHPGSLFLLVAPVNNINSYCIGRKVTLDRLSVLLDWVCWILVDLSDECEAHFWDAKQKISPKSSLNGLLNIAAHFDQLNLVFELFITGLTMIIERRGFDVRCRQFVIVEIDVHLSCFFCAEV